MREDPAIEDLLRLATEGDAQAAGRAVIAHDDRLRGIVRLRLDPRIARRVDPDDVLQEVHVEALARLPEFLSARRVPFFVWLRFLALQRCVTLSRHHLGAAARDVRRERALPLESRSDATSLSLAHVLQTSLASPSAGAARDEIEARVHAAVDALDPPDREILCMRHFEGLDNGEAAAALRIAPSAASKRYWRALARLKDEFRARGLEAPPST